MRRLGASHSRSIRAASAATAPGIRHVEQFGADMAEPDDGPELIARGGELLGVNVDDDDPHAGRRAMSGRGPPDPARAAGDDGNPVPLENVAHPIPSRFVSSLVDGPILANAGASRYGPAALGGDECRLGGIRGCGRWCRSSWRFSPDGAAAHLPAPARPRPAPRAAGRRGRRRAAGGDARRRRRRARRPGQRQSALACGRDPQSGDARRAERSAAPAARNPLGARARGRGHRDRRSPGRRCAEWPAAGLKAVAALALTGHSKREIAFLLDLPDTALRQRLSALRRTLAERGIPMPATTLGLNLDLQYGRIRDVLLPLLLAQGGTIASHDPDGHLFVVRKAHKGVTGGN